MRPLKNLSEIAVIGGGLAGLAAARHAVRLGRLVTLFEGSGLWGGQVATVGEISGLPFPGNWSGQDLAIRMLESVQKVAAGVVESHVTSLEAGGRLSITDAEGGVWHPEAVIVATGARLRALGVPGEEALLGKGVSRCATCDGGFFRGGDVVVTGGGDAAVHEALELAKLVRQVIMVCRSPMKAKREYIDRLNARDNVRFVWDSEVSEILGDEGVAGVRIRNVRTGAASEIACTGVFPFVGVERNDTLVRDDPRVFTIGAARAGFGGQVVQAMAEGIGAAEAAHALLAKGGWDG